MPTPAPSIHLQGHGLHPAKLARDLEPGDLTVWNYGSTAMFVSVLKETAKQIVARMVDDRGHSWLRRMGKDRLVAVTTKLTVSQRIRANYVNRREPYHGLSREEISKHNRECMFGPNDEAFPSREERSRIVD
jgi:hypothetical protein